MSNPRQVAAVVIWAACMFSFSCYLALAGPVARSTVAPATAAPMVPPGATQSATQPQARVYLFRGALGPIFSRGMDRLTERLEQAGIRADANEFTICRLVPAPGIPAFRRDPPPLVLTRHSLGGHCALTFAPRRPL